MAKTEFSFGVKLLTAFFILFFAGRCLGGRPAGSVNLIPEQPGKTPSYWCTWGAQNYASDDASFEACVELKGHFPMAEVLTEKNVFHTPGWANYFQKARGDLFLMFDLGWDTTPGVRFDNERWRLGTLEVSTEKFPSCTGTPAERLWKLNQLAKAAGWRGAAIWLAAQATGDGKTGQLIDKAALEEYWRERARCTRYAGIEYWKVDYGERSGNAEFREMLTRIAAEEAPGLIVEHGRGSGPLNDEECPWDTKDYTRSGGYRKWGNGEVLKQAAALVKFSQILRTYDVTAYFSVPTTLDRAAQILSEFSGRPDVACIINCEDEPYIAAALGCAMGILRHPLWRDEPAGAEYDPANFRKRIDEVTRAVRWQRIAPAFAVGKTENLLDPNVHIDTWRFRHGDSWAVWMDGREAVQSAPARVSRGMPLPTVSVPGGGPAPYVIASHNPNGAICVAALPRISTGKGIYFPVADIAIEADDVNVPIGIFGRYKSLTVKFPAEVGKARVLAQDLAGDAAIDITGKVKLEGNSITLYGKLINKVGLSAASHGDLSEPGMVFTIKR